MSDRPILTRRDFVRGSAGTVLAASVLGGAVLGSAKRTHAQTGEDAAATRSPVIVVRDADVQSADRVVDKARLGEMLAATVTGVTGAATAAEAWSAMFRPDDIVGVVKSDFMNHTHGELLQLVLASLHALGIPQENILDAQKDNGAVEQCTALICMPALKAHWLTGIGTVLKNYIMFSGKPSQYHKEGSAKLGEIWNMDHVAGKTRLVLVDALRPMCNKGPQPDPRYRWNYNGLVAGTDPVAVETISLRILENKREAHRGEPWPLTPPPVCIEEADTTYGLGVSDPDRIDVQLVGWEDEALL
jgi:hypothetical protein